MSARLLVVSPWGLGGGYSGPVTLMNRLFGATGLTNELVDVVYRDRTHEIFPDWARTTVALLTTGSERFKPIDQLIWLWRLSRFLAKRGGEYDVVHLHGCYLLNLLPSLFLPQAVAIALFPVLEDGDLKVTGRGPLRTIKQIATRRAVRRADIGFALSAGIAAELIRHGLDVDRVVRVGNPVSLEIFGYPGPRTGPTGGTVRLGFVGKLSQTKQPHLVLEAVRLLRARGLKASATFVGPYADDAYGLYFQRIRDELQLAEHVDVTGYTESVASYLKHSMDIFVLVSSAEGMPGALAEAMMSGLPCVVSDVGAMGETVRSARCGFVVAAEVGEIVTAVERLSGDLDEWTKLSNAGARFAVNSYSNDVVSRKYIEGLLSVTKNS